MRQVLKQYEALLLHIPPQAGPMDRQPSPREAYAHVHGMLETIEKFLDEGTPEAWDKANRWLGFLQGVFWLHGTYTLNQMRDHNRTETPAEKLMRATPEELADAAFAEACKRA